MNDRRSRRLSASAAAFLADIYDAVAAGAALSRYAAAVANDLKAAVDGTYSGSLDDLTSRANLVVDHLANDL